jgi:hypothetical protein
VVLGCGPQPLLLSSGCGGEIAAIQARGDFYSFVDAEASARQSGWLRDAYDDRAIVVARFLEEQQQFGAVAQARLTLLAPDSAGA